MKTPMQELINQVEQWMLDDKEVLKNPSAWPNYLLVEANKMIDVKSEFIEMCKEMLEKEKEQIINAYEQCIEDGYWDPEDGYTNQFKDAEQYYNETFNTKGQ